MVGSARYASSLAGAQGRVKRSRRCIESYCRFLKMYLVRVRVRVRVGVRV